MVGRRGSHARNARIAVAACVLLCACTTPASAPSGTGVRGLFRGGGSSYPSGGAAWYSPEKPPQFAKTGAAAWHGEGIGRRRGVGAWISRVFRRGKPPGEPPSPTAVIAADAALPLPSMVTVTNIQTYATVTVRVDQRAPMGRALISLGRDTAAALGVEAGEPVTVRVRYAGPVVAYRQRTDVRQAMRRPVRRDVQLAAVPPPAGPAPPPALNAAIVNASAEVAPKLRPAIPPPPALRGQLTSVARIQVAAFAVRGNADRAVAMLRPAGAANVETVQRGHATLYRVTLRAPQDAGQAQALRQKVMKIGFADARLVRPS